MTQRAQSYDLIIIGGGINGCAIAAEAAIKGLSVCLIEKDTIASGTSSKSSNLIHGGLRYLENYDFKLVRAALNEQAIWQQRAPNLVRPLKFVLPHEKHLRPRWMLRIGLWLYDHLSSKKRLPHAKSIDRNNDNVVFAPLKNNLQTGFAYYDCLTNGEQLTHANAQLAKNFGATILEKQSFSHASAIKDHWAVECIDEQADVPVNYHSKVLINAAGPWACMVNEHISPTDPNADLQLIQGSHIIVPKLYNGDHAYILQHKDGRIVFTLPYDDNQTAIGTTDIPYEGDLDNVTIADEEKTYLCELVNNYFEKQVEVSDIIGSWSGVRALASSKDQSASKLSREHQLALCHQGQAPLLTVLGGKLTSARLVAEESLALLKPFFANMDAQSSKTIPLENQ